MEPVGFCVGKQDDTHKGFEHTWAGDSIERNWPIAMQHFACGIGIRQFQFVEMTKLGPNW
jgi:hypothetical protein